MGAIYEHPLKYDPDEVREIVAYEQHMFDIMAGNILKVSGIILPGGTLCAIAIQKDNREVK